MGWLYAGKRRPVRPEIFFYTTRAFRTQAREGKARWEDYKTELQDQSDREAVELVVLKYLASQLTLVGLHTALGNTAGTLDPSTCSEQSVEHLKKRMDLALGGHEDGEGNICTLWK